MTWWIVLFGIFMVTIMVLFFMISNMISKEIALNMLFSETEDQARNYQFPLTRLVFILIATAGLLGLLFDVALVYRD